MWPLNIFLFIVPLSVDEIPEMRPYFTETNVYFCKIANKKANLQASSEEEALELGKTNLRNVDVFLHYSLSGLAILLLKLVQCFSSAFLFQGSLIVLVAQSCLDLEKSQ